MSNRNDAPVRLFAPAKVNLGLEVTGKRIDGYHDVVTVLQAISLFDVIDIRPSRQTCVVTTSGVPEHENLVTRALKEIERRCGVNPGYQIRISKGIPEAAGLGGGSSDAGTVLTWLADTLYIDAETIHEVASSLGSDVPFFLSSGTALARGTGIDLEVAEPHQRYWYVLVAPNLDIPGKTGELYRQLQCDDFSDGAETLKTVALLTSGAPVEALPLRNTFRRPLLAYSPVREAIARLREAGARVVLPSGAGPAVIALCDTFDEARSIARALPPGAGQIHIATSLRHRPGT